MMAEHPEEVDEITSVANALCLNLGSITRDRLLSMGVSAAAARDHGVPIIIDLVGAACSTLRKNFLQEFINKYKPAVLKGNITEILSTCGIECRSSGVEANKEQLIDEQNVDEYAKFLGQWAKEHSAVLLVSGPIDFITDGENSYMVHNGVPMLGNITGTGCMLNAMVAALLPSGNPLMAALLGAITLGIAGEKAEQVSDGPGTFHMKLFDEVYNLKDADIITKGKIIKL